MKNLKTITVSVLVKMFPFISIKNLFKSLQICSDLLQSCFPQGEDIFKIGHKTLDFLSVTNKCCFFISEIEFLRPFSCDQKVINDFSEQ